MSLIRHTFISFLFLASLFTVVPGNVLHASPVRRTEIVLFQPDGRSFEARLSGDEFLKILTTRDGCSIIQDDEGYYCYAVYDADGNLSGTGYRVGDAVPAAVRNASVHIPYSQLSGIALKKRAVHALKPASCAQGYGRMTLSGTGDMPSGVSNVRVIVLLVEFKDLKFTYSKSDFKSLLNQKGYNKNGAMGSAKDYFDAQFAGKCTFTFDVSNIVTLDHNYRYYGKNLSQGDTGSDVNLGEMIAEACMKADSEIDFSMYDNDSDGTLDHLLVFYAGGDEAAGAGSDHIWSKSGFLSTSDIELTCDGVKIDSYACTSERASDGLGTDPIAGIGTFCHEFGHSLGLPDLYDYSGKAAALWGRTALMDRGNLNNGGNTPPNLNAIERQILGLSKPELLAEGAYELLPINGSGQCLMAPTDKEGEYFLFECRKAEGWDSHIGGEGLLIYHIDKSDNYAGGVKASERWSMTGSNANTVNSVEAHQCADLVEADPDAVFSGIMTSADMVRRVFFPYGGNDSFTHTSDPAFVSWSGELSDLSITGITYSEGKVGFNVMKNEYSGIPSAENIEVDEFQDAAIVKWTAEGGLTAEVAIFSSDGGWESICEVEPYAPGMYSMTFEGLSPSSIYQVNISYSIGDLHGRIRSKRIITHPATSYTPYIYLQNIERNGDMSFPAGTAFPLRLYNAIGAETVTWTMDGKVVSPSEDGYYRPGRSGMLKAVAVFPDGSQYIVMKYIEIK